MRAWIVVAAVICLVGTAGDSAPVRADDGVGGPRSAPLGTAPPRVYLQNLGSSRDLAVFPARSGMQVQNLDPANPADVWLDIAGEVPGSGVAISMPSIHPFGAYNVYLPSEAKLPPDRWYAATFSGDRPLAAISRTEWPLTGGSAMFSNSIPATDVIVPLLVRRYAGQSSVVRIQNADSAQPVDATIRIHAIGLGEVAVLSRTIRPEGFVTLDMADVDTEFDTLPASFAGWLRVQSDVPVAASSYVAYDNGSRAVYGFEAVPADMAADRLYAPLVRNNYFGTTGISVVNPGATDARVTVRFAGSLSRANITGCVGRTFTQGPVTVPAGASALFYQANVAIPGTGVSPLPADCAGAATIEVADGGKVLAVVNDATGEPARPASAAAYNAVSAARGAKRVALPLYRNRHTRAQLTTGIMAMNISQDPAQAQIEFHLSDGTVIGDAACGSACLALIPPGAAQLWFPASMVVLPANKYGSAFIASDQPLAVIVNDASLTGALDAAIYSGMKADEVSPDRP